MDFIAHFFWNHMISISQEVRMIDGKEEVCLIVPTKTNQIKRGKHGDWLSTFRMVAEPPNAEMITHTLQLGYLNYDEVKQAKKMHVYDRTQKLGRVREHDRTPSKKIDRTNHASDIMLDGIIVLSDIPKDLIFREGHNRKRYISKLAFRCLNGNDGMIFTGSVCIDDIPRDCIETNLHNGKKFIKARLKKMEHLDTYFNTHELVIARPDSEDVISIGLFKEWRKEGYVPTNEPLSYPEVPNNNQRDLPSEINGIRF